MANVPCYRVLVLGEAKVGKSSLVQRYVFDVFTEGGPPQSGRDEEQVIVRLKNNNQVELRICDTDGQERADLLTKQYYKGTDAIIFVYDITNSRTLWDSDNWIRDWNIHIPNFSSIPVLFVGNKCDVPKPCPPLDDDDDEEQEQEPEPDFDERGESADEEVRDFVDPGAVKTLVRRHHFVRTPLECSARTGAGVRRVFERIAAELTGSQSRRPICVCL